MDLAAEFRRCMGSGHVHDLAETEICVLQRLVSVLKDLVVKSDGTA